MPKIVPVLLNVVCLLYLCRVEWRVLNPEDHFASFK